MKRCSVLGAVILGAWVLMSLLPMLVLYNGMVADADTFAPGDSVVLIACLSGTTGFLLTDDTPDSVVAEIYMINPSTGLPDYWKRVYLAEADTALWVAFTRADSTNDANRSLGGHYYAEITAWSVQGGRVHDVVNWKISDVMTVYGPRQVRVKTTHSSGTLVAGASVAFRDMGGTVLASGQTDTGGWYTFWRPSVSGTDTIEVFMGHANVTWTLPETMYVSTADVDSIYDGTLYNPSAPPDTGLTHIRGTLLLPGSSTGVRTPREGIIVRFELSRGDNAYITGALISRHAFQDTTDANGVFDVYATPNDHLSPSGTRYRSWILDSPGEGKEFAVPDTTNGVVVKYEDL